MPKVKKTESKKKYISRAIPVIMREHPEKTINQAAGQAGGMFDSAKKKSHKTTRKTTRRKS